MKREERKSSILFRTRQLDELQLTALQVGRRPAEQTGLPRIRSVRWTGPVTWTGANADELCALVVRKWDTLRAHVTATVERVESLIGCVVDDDH